MQHGLFLTFEGGEGAGKTTLIEEVAKALASQGFSVLKTREPGGTHFGEMIRSILLQKKEGMHICPYAELSLFLASRAQHISDIIGPALKKGSIVLCDRFNDSTIAYQGAARGLGMQKVAEFCEFISQGLQPNLTLLLDIDPRVGLSRAMKDREHDRIESEKLSFHEKIREGYHLLLEQHPKRIRLLDGAKSQSEVLRDALDRIEPLLQVNVV